MYLYFIFFYRWSYNFHRYLVNMVLQYGTSFQIVGLLESAFYSSLLVYGGLYLLPTWDIYIALGPLPNDVIHLQVVVEWSIRLWPCVRVLITLYLDARL